MDNKEKQNRSGVKAINKTGRTGMTREKKETLKKSMGSASAPIDLNTIREWAKYGDNRDRTN
ncbi:hypothetical protein [Neobacillus sp.]|uniref:hypothetical protein n=1 Tax=Neobacillus sp. TaxID=2675273 RepID=UPI0035B5355D